MWAKNPPAQAGLKENIPEFRRRDQVGQQICRMNIFGNQKKSAAQLVTNGRFEIENKGDVASLEYSLAGKILELIHTEVPKSMRGTGAASLLAETALQWAREHQVRVDVICPFVAEYLGKHPEYSDLVLR